MRGLWQRAYVVKNLQVAVVVLLRLNDFYENVHPSFGSGQLGIIDLASFAWPWCKPRLALLIHIFICLDSLLRACLSFGCVFYVAMFAGCGERLGFSRLFPLLFAFDPGLSALLLLHLLELLHDVVESEGDHPVRWWLRRRREAALLFSRRMHGDR